jgi:hypothetical protein
LSETNHSAVVDATGRSQDTEQSAGSRQPTNMFRCLILALFAVCLCNHSL